MTTVQTYDMGDIPVPPNVVLKICMKYCFYVVNYEDGTSANVWVYGILKVVDIMCTI